VIPTTTPQQPVIPTQSGHVADTGRRTAAIALVCGLAAVPLTLACGIFGSIAAVAGIVLARRALAATRAAGRPLTGWPAAALPVAVAALVVNLFIITAAVAYFARLAFTGQLNYCW